MKRWRICPGVPVIAEHHHDRTGRYCYWIKYGTFSPDKWFVRDRVTGREVCCLNMRQVRTWITGAKIFRLRHDTGRVTVTRVKERR